MNRFERIDWSNTSIPEGLKKRLQELSDSAFDSAKILNSFSLNSDDWASGILGTGNKLLVPTGYATLTAARLSCGGAQCNIICSVFKCGPYYTMCGIGSIDDPELYVSSNTSRWILYVPELFASPLSAAKLHIYDNEELADATVSSLEVVDIDITPDVDSQPELAGFGAYGVYGHSNNHTLVPMTNARYGSKCPMNIYLHLTLCALE